MTQKFRNINPSVTGMLDTGNRPEEVIQHAVKERVAKDRLFQHLKYST